MFCSKCGAENDNNSRFCTKCGTVLFNKNFANDTIRRAQLLEAISISVNPKEEQEMINLHQKMGWTLKSSQEINTSETHVYGSTYNGNGHVNSYVVNHNYVKLTFERNKNMPNYNVLKANYNRFCELKAKKDMLEKQLGKRSAKFWILTALGAVIPFLISIPLAISASKSAFDPEWNAVLYIFISLLVNGGVYGIIMAIAYPVTGSSKKTKLAPQINNIINQMKYIADDSERYL